MAMRDAAGTGAGGGPEATLHAWVSGRVQGVGFRFFVVREARRLGVVGDVRNLWDGRVEVRAQGARGALESLLERLREGPRLGRVEDVEAAWDETMEPALEFTIR